MDHLGANNIMEEKITKKRRGSQHMAQYQRSCHGEGRLLAIQFLGDNTASRLLRGEGSRSRTQAGNDFFYCSPSIYINE